ncbi:hypothetical protein IRJ41_012077 [Triplophysa rosa]|uniref:Uncharacterized protein n=1 Tax=Triplophysa rosa TaxID=992332 RepID=A0A9W7WIL3_TRIRA|nr:hypothetical protein IRJ41_012077 [Triplophysa rosa]
MLGCISAKPKSGVWTWSDGATPWNLSSINLRKEFVKPSIKSHMKLQEGKI